MALPTLETAIYELELPSTGEIIHYRPFLVKEQKMLMIAQESENEKVVEKAFADIISACVEEKIDAYKMPLFDIEYVFLKLRGKSMGENVDLEVVCPDDEETKVQVKVNLDEIEVLTHEDHTLDISLTDDIKLVMKYPTLKEMSKFDNKGYVKSVFAVIRDCIAEVHDGDDIHMMVDITAKEMDTFIESMTTQHFEKVNRFFETMPKLQHEIEVTNPNTKKKGTVLVQGLESFFV